jgi:hypothetical protein
MRNERTSRRHAGALTAALLTSVVLTGCAPDRAIEQEIAGQRASYDISATTLYKRYSDNQINADSKYKGKVLLVSGTVARTEKQFSGAMAVTLKANDIGTGVQCLFSRDRAYDAEKLKGEITVKGKCDGWNMGVVLRGCKVVE